jgi:hypothetical protein
VARVALNLRIREAWHRLSHLDARPDQVAAGFSIGVFAALLPLNPSPILVATLVAWLLQRNVMAAVVGAVVSILFVPLLPLIWWAEYRLGELVIPVQRPPAWGQARLWDLVRQGWDVYAAMLAGSIILAIPVMLLTYLVVKRLADRWSRQRNESQPSG